MTESREIWLAGREHHQAEWTLLGIFQTQEAAVAACFKEFDFVVEVIVGEVQNEASPRHYPCEHLYG